jgi:hypothetical protein
MSHQKSKLQDWPLHLFKHILARCSWFATNFKALDTKDNHSILYPLTFQVLMLQRFYQLPTSPQPATSATAGTAKKKLNSPTPMEMLAAFTGSAIPVISFYALLTSKAIIP